MLVMLINCPTVMATPFKRRVPLTGNVSMRTAARVCVASASVNAKLLFTNVNVVSSAVVTVAFALLGGVLAPTFTATVFVEVPPFPSETEYVIVAGPLKLRAGTNRRVPSLLMETVPCAAGTVALVTLSISPSTSVSFPSTLMLVIVVLMAVLALSVLATGLSLTGVTVKFTVAVDIPPLLSETVYVKLAGPL